MIFLTFCANHNHAYSIVEHPNVPTPSPEGCPQNTKGCTEFGCPNTCYCADHCSWEKCKISPPPLSCLHRTGSTWQWSSGWWTAKKIGKYIVIFDHITNIMNFDMCILHHYNWVNIVLSILKI